MDTNIPLNSIRASVKKKCQKSGMAENMPRLLHLKMKNPNITVSVLHSVLIGFMGVSK